jgi:hypothetical protein
MKTSQIHHDTIVVQLTAIYSIIIVESRGGNQGNVMASHPSTAETINAERLIIPQLIKRLILGLGLGPA